MFDMKRTIKKVLVVDARMICASGIGIYLQNILAGLVGYFDISLIGKRQEIAGFDWAERTELIECDASIYSVREQVALPRLIPRCRVFWTPHFVAPLWPIRAQRKLVTIHDVYHLAFRKNLPLSQQIYANRMYRHAVRFAERLITVSRASRNEIIRYTGCPPEKIVVVPNGVDQQRFFAKPDRKTVETVRQKYALPSRFLLFVGNVKPHKNLQTLIVAFRELLQAEPDVHLLIVGNKEGFITGDREIFRRIETEEQLRRRVRFSGHVTHDDLPTIYHQAELFVFPSLYEGFGLPPLEAMASGCPVVASGIQSIQEVCGDAAAYFDPASPGELRDVLTALLRDSRARAKLKTLGLRRAEQFSWKTSVEKHKALLEEMLVNPAPEGGG